VSQPISDPFPDGYRGGNAAYDPNSEASKIVPFPARQDYQGQRAADLSSNYDAESTKKIEPPMDFGGPKMDPPSSALVHAEIAASEARSETKMVRLEGKFDTISATILGKLDAVSEKMTADHEYNRSTRLVIVSTVAGVAVALAALVVAMATYGDTMFGRGMNVKDVVQAVIKETGDRSSATPK
jgi:hypothetical protein